MSAYVIVDIDVHDPVGYEEYKKLAPAAVRYTVANMSRAADIPKRLKAVGHRAVW